LKVLLAGVVRLKIVFATLLCCFVLVSSTAAQQNAVSGTDALVRQLTDKLGDADKKGVLVVDLKPAEGEASGFGSWLLKAKNLAPAEESEFKNTMPLSKAIGANTLVVGSYGAADKGIGVTLVAFRVAEFENPQSKTFMIGMVNGKIPLAQLGDHLDVTLDSLRPKDGIYKAGVGGVSVPSVVKFVPPAMKVPDIDLQGLLREKRHGGTLMLRFVVNAEGRATQITVGQPIGFGVDEQYIKALPESQFNPAVDADNRPVPVRFHMTFAVNLQ
jgi:hypothetical protein